ncbi:unnamed protein product [Pieris brassicae]|uniref:protein acetyllysine N-acetyltransferase n=1 Tax=Pieris brassicae TaxID=7116 RepID=A0A9P0T4P3_PIEBR|nr:unnamed protein product [Pieris brassicae]
MAGRQRVRSSARLSGSMGVTAVTSSGTVEDERLAAARTAAALLRRARAAQAAERAREVEDSPLVLREKCRQLAKALQEAKHLVVYTGAGISTAADIPDYRGPSGVWTRLRRGESVARVDVARAQPTFTHMALTALWRRGLLKFVVSQNCDGLHLRAGLPRRALAELHGDMFAERCPACRRVYLRAFDTTERTARHAHSTRRLCHRCGRELRDTIVHFGERGRAAWPLNWAGALRHANAADVVLCLGSSLKVLRRYPRLWRMQRAPNARPALYIVNLQWTPKDSAAALKINARCDAVMAAVARRLRLNVPLYDSRADPLLAHAEPLAPPESHTTRRPPLTPPPPPLRRHYSPSPPSSAADSDEELPLCKLASRLRGARSPALRSFRVTLRSGDATILLRSEHAPAEPPPPEPPPSRRELGLRVGGDDGDELDSKLRDLLFEPKAEWDVAAAAFIERAMLVCRARLYPGLHTIIAPSSPAPPPPTAECDWCARRYAARRCLWYGPPRLTPPERRAWRRDRGERFLCACCGEDGGAASATDADGGGWYGKGYRKGRRRRR